jgi:uncharacterized protein YerC
MNEEEQVQPIPKLYIDSTINESNQSILRKSYLMELLTMQAKTNDILSHSVSTVHNELEKTNSKQLRQFENILLKMEMQQEISDHLKNEVHLNDLNNKEVMERLKDLETTNREVSKTLEEEKLMSQATIDQLSFQEDLTRKIHNKLENYEQLYKDIQQKMIEQEAFYDQINRQLEIQDMFHQTVIQRMDKQDSNTKQIENKMDSLREAMIGKIETAIDYFETKYKQTLFFLGNLLNPKEKRLIHRFPQQKDEPLEENEEIKKG